jgi:hypothetical protein
MSVSRNAKVAALSLPLDSGYPFDEPASSVDNAK